MNYYPIMLNIAGKKCVIIGGGRVAFRKVSSLIEHNASVSVISHDLCDEFEKIRDKITWIPRNYEQGDVRGASLVFSATNDRRVDKQVCEEAKALGIPVNVADTAELCDFITPSQIKQGDLTIAISTNGKSPMFAKKIRQELEQEFDSHYADFLDLLGELRKQSVREIPDQLTRKALYRDIIYSDLQDQLKKGSIAYVQSEIHRIYELYKSGKQL